MLGIINEQAGNEYALLITPNEEVEMHLKFLFAAVAVTRPISPRHSNRKYNFQTNTAVNSAHYNMFTLRTIPK